MYLKFLFQPKRLRQIILIITVLALTLVVIDYFAYPYTNSAPVTHANNGENGLWIRYTYYFGQNDGEQTRRLAQQLKQEQIRYAYFHVRYIGQSGKLYFHYQQAAQKLNEQVHRQAPGIRSIAWVYIGNKRGGTGVNLNDSVVRKNIVQEAHWLTTECGFDGVQWDYEICEDNNRSFLSLLEETRSALAPQKIVGVSTAVWMPTPLRTLGYGWSEEYLRQVAEHSDQIAVMGYDSGIYLPRAYVALMAKQVQVATHAAATGNAHCRVLIGIPTYEKGGLSHHAHAENITFALRGVQDGLSHISPEEKATFAGVALFADYTTSGDEWSIYHRLWLNQ